MMVMHGYLTTAGRFVMTSGSVLPWVSFVTPTDRPDERTPAPEEDDIQETTETVEETLEPAPRDLDDDPDEDDE
jgi:hypothetical protein